MPASERPGSGAGAGQEPFGPSSAGADRLRYLNELLERQPLAVLDELVSIIEEAVREAADDEATQPDGVVEALNCMRRRSCPRD